MDTLFWWTGALVWIVIALGLAIVIFLILYEITGATIMMWRIIAAVKRADIPLGRSRDNLRIWWRLVLGYYGYKSWTIKNSGEKVKWPRPWYRAEDDKEWLPA